MLGRTNLTTVEGGVIVSDIEDYSWNTISIDGVTGTFVKAIYENNTLVAITKDGTIVYTEDGENWESVRLDLEENYELNDIIWDGNRYIIVGSRITEGNSGQKHIGLIAVSNNLEDFTISFDEERRASRYLAVMVKDSKYIIIRISVNIETGNYYCYIDSLVGNINSLESKYNISYGNAGVSSSGESKAYDVVERSDVYVAQKSDKYLVYVKSYRGAFSGLSGYSHQIYTTSDGIIYTSIETKALDDGNKVVDVFECKDDLYYCTKTADLNYEFNKIIGTSEKAVISTNINYSFIDAVYFNKCEIYINAHQMLTVKPGEQIAEKTLDDLIEITYDFSMVYIEKAFEKLYIFGTGGNVLVSSDEIKNEESLAVKTMSATKALYDAKAYTDEKIAELEARIAALEVSMADK